MSFATKYRSEFKDRLGLLWRVDIEEDGYAGAITDLKATGSPLNFEFLSNSDNIFEDPVHGSTAQIGIYSETDFAWTSLYNYGNLVYRVSIYHGVSYTLYWRGFINSDGYEEPYDGVAYPVSLSASDGLGMLKDMLYKYQTTEPDDTYYNGRQFASQIIIDILSKINISGFTEFINLYDIGMDDAVTDSPFDQYKIDVDVFKDMYCYEVLEEILKKYNACIRQVAGSMVIYRPADLKEATIYGRIFTTATAHTGTTLAPDQYIDRKTALTDHIVPDGGTMMILPPAKKIKLTQDYGYKESWIDNYNFKPETFDGTTFDGWIKATTNTIFPISQRMPPEQYGVGQDGTNYTGYVYQNFGALSVATSDVFMFEFEWLVFNNYGAEIPMAMTDGVIQIVNEAGNKYLYEIDDEFAGWGTTPSYIMITTPNPLPVGASEWTKWTRKIVGIPSIGSYQIRIYKGWSGVSYVTIAVKELKFYSTSDKVIKKKFKHKRKSWVKKVFFPFRKEPQLLSELIYQDEIEVVDHSFEMLNTIKGIDIENDYMLGDVPNVSSPASDRDTDIDNVIEQFAGSLSLYNIMTLADAAEAFVINHAADYLPGGVIVTQGTGSNTHKLIFTGTERGVNFTGSTTITNTSTDLSGTVSVQMAVTAVARVDNVYITGDGGSVRIIIDGVSRLCEFNTSIAQTISGFVAAYGSDYTRLNVTAYSTYIKFAAKVAGVDFIGGSSVTQVDAPLTGSVTYPIANRTATYRIDTITLTGSTGTADILCDGVTKEAAVLETNELTTLWHKGPDGTEDKPLLELIGDELALQHSLPQQFLSLPIIEKGENSINPLIKVVGNFQDPLNVIGAYKKIFAINGAVFDVKNREWEMDMNEILKTPSEPIVTIIIREGQSIILQGSLGSITRGDATLSYSFTVTNLGGENVGLYVFKNDIVHNEWYFEELVQEGVECSGTIEVDTAGYGDEYRLEIVEV